MNISIKLNETFKIESCMEDALDGPRRRKNTIHESFKVSFNFIEIFRPRRDLNVQFSELYS